MKIPYNAIHASGNIFFAARGGKIHTFNLDGTHISTWKHPDVEKVAAAEKAKAEEAEKPVGEDTEMVEAGDLEEPPAKRQKVSEDETKGNGNDETSETVAAEKSNAEKKGGKGGKKSKNRQKNDQTKKESLLPRVPDRPVITHMTSTSDGRHLLAISGHDKNIWVFEHDRKGQLTQLSQR
jgi:tRNA (guanine-N(7)-)-methyltransferase subunit TRM82